MRVNSQSDFFDADALQFKYRKYNANNAWKPKVMLP